MALINGFQLHPTCCGDSISVDVLINVQLRLAILTKEVSACLKHAVNSNTESTPFRLF